MQEHVKHFKNSSQEVDSFRVLLRSKLEGIHVGHMENW